MGMVLGLRGAHTEIQAHGLWSAPGHLEQKQEGSPSQK